MTLGELAKKFAGLRIRETRARRDDYEEHVIYTIDIEQWNIVLKEILGPPVKPAGVVPTIDDLVACQKYGSILKNQVLFKKTFGDTMLIAMLWPWMDGLHTTLKLCLFNGKQKAFNPS